MNKKQLDCTQEIFGDLRLQSDPPVKVAWSASCTAASHPKLEADVGTQWVYGVFVSNTNKQRGQITKIHKVSALHEHRGLQHHSRAWASAVPHSSIGFPDQPAPGLAPSEAAAWLPHCGSTDAGPALWVLLCTGAACGTCPGA